MKLRTTNIRKLRKGVFDVLCVGGGINGAIAAAALSARGAKVALIDRGDFGGLTSQESSNLAWGGIKYLESLEFGLVRKLCMSRNALLRAYPSTVQEIRFYATHPKGFRHSRFKLWLGTWLYWFLGNCFTKRPRLLSKATMAHEEPVIALDHATGGFEYSDAYLHDNDTRFVFNFVRAALNASCIAANYVESLGARHSEGGVWTVRARDVASNDPEFEIRARVLINACGPLVDHHNALSSQQTRHHHVLSKGVHLIVNRVTKARRVLSFFADDGRPYFVVPMGPRTCIGTTDTPVDSERVQVTDEDRRFILDNINRCLQLEQPLTTADIIAERVGVRPLVMADDGSGNRDWMQLSRKHAVEVNAAEHHISIFGGKLTDCLNVGEEITQRVQELGVALSHPHRRWYGEPPDEVRDEFFHEAALMRLDDMTPPTSSERLSSRLWRRYAGEAIVLLEQIRADPSMAELLIEGAEYLRCEIEQAARREMIVKLEDFLRRRSKISLVIPRDAVRHAAGLREACGILFGDEADAKIEEYFAAEATRAQ